MTRRDCFLVGAVILCVLFAPSFSQLAAQTIAEAGALEVAGHAPLGDVFAETNELAAPVYTLGPGDELRIRILETQDLSVESTRVSTEGYLSLPLLGRVPVEGFTVAELEENLAHRYSSYVLDPHITVEMLGFRSQPVSVIGAVRQPGVYQIDGVKTLVEVLSMAGGILQDAGYTVRVTRRLEWGRIPASGERIDPTGRFSVADVRLAAVTAGESPRENIVVKPQDVISVPRGETVYVIGSVAKSGGFVLSERENISVLEVLALAGGLSKLAAPKNARILRHSEMTGDRQELAVNIKQILQGDSPEVSLKGNDILFIPEAGSKVALNKAVDTALRIGTGLMIWRVGR